MLVSSPHVKRGHVSSNAATTLRPYCWTPNGGATTTVADCDDLSIEADQRALTPEDFARVRELLKLRPMQFCIFLRALFGDEEMQRMMVEAIGVAKQS